MPCGPDVETNLAISSANHLKVRFIQQSQEELNIQIIISGEQQFDITLNSIPD
ncbi:hypothetical protein [Arsenophonus endosymbiont of Aphis craccivora]|uniref:hypothetical protein n=1 Tax=Arsenophonus endosymbiont of Aphis craccivora TaxID=1231049 RepID=UPI0015DF2F0F|nr:hypothetical protein [Arsenophonus endosymbiont of Aphis craccivora]